jgi:hypothetical protein
MIDVLERLNNKKIGGKHVAIRYAKHVDAVDDKASKQARIAALAAGNISKSSIADKRSKIQLIEEQLRNLQNASNDFEINLNKPSASPAEPLIKKYQFNKDQPQSSSGRYHNYQKRRRKPY